MIEQFEQHWPLGSKERLMFDVFLYIGLRRGDAARLGKQHIRNGVLHLMTEKSGGTMPVYVPVHPALAASINACPSSGLAIIAKDDGTHYTRKGSAISFARPSLRPGFRCRRRAQTKRAIPLTACARHLRPSPPSPVQRKSELNAMFGWSGYQMAQLYTRKADRKRLAARALAKWTRPSSDDVAAQGNSRICIWKKNGPRTSVVTTYGAVVISGGKDQQNQCDQAMWWAREDSNLQPDRYERSALTIELQARTGSAQTPEHIASRGRNDWQSPATRRYIRSNRLALPLRIFALSSSHSGTVSIHSTPGGLATNGQSTANRMRSTPISCTQHISAGLEKLPLVVIQKLLQKMSRKLICLPRPAARSRGRCARPGTAASRPDGRG